MLGLFLEQLVRDLGAVCLFIFKLVVVTAIFLAPYILEALIF